ncbi:hypothetical protein [Morganella morganii]|uniref:hypothetical protein n=2 Tax=Gammaproteobacteria TaxID=1236 RepID=UPI003EB99B91
MEITSDQKRTICAMLAEQAGHPVRSAEITALCDDETIRAALLVLSSLIDVKYREVSAALAAARAEHERNNPQMMMGSPLANSTLSAPADIPVSLPDTAHTVFPPAAEPEPLIVPPAPEEPVITDNTTAAVQSASAEEQAFAEIDRLSAIFGQHAFLPDAPSVPEPAVFHPGDPEPDFTFVFNEPAVAEPLSSSPDSNATEFTFVYNEPAVAGPVVADPVIPAADNSIAEPAPVCSEPATINPLSPAADDKTTAPVSVHTDPVVAEPAVAEPVVPAADDKFSDFTFIYNEPVAAGPVVADPVIPPAENSIAESAPVYPEPVTINPLSPAADDKTTAPAFAHAKPAVAEPVAAEPVIAPADDESAEFTFVYNEPAAAPAAPTATDNTVLTASVFSDKSLFPEPAALSDPLKGGSWLFDDLDTDDTDTPVIGELPQSAQSLSSTEPGDTIIAAPQTPETSAGSTSDTLRDNSWSFSADTTPDPLQTESAEQKPWGLTALFAAGREDIPPQAAPDPVPESAGKTAVTPDPSPDSKAQATMTQPSGQPAIRVKIGRARLSESFSSPVTATLDDGRAVTILGIYFQRNIGLSFNDRTGILHGTPTEYGEFPVRVVWELAPKKRFSSDIHFAVDPGSHSTTTPAPAGFPPQ